MNVDLLFQNTKLLLDGAFSTKHRIREIYVLISHYEFDQGWKKSGFVNQIFY